MDLELVSYYLKELDVCKYHANTEMSITFVAQEAEELGIDNEAPRISIHVLVLSVVAL